MNERRERASVTNDTLGARRDPVKRSAQARASPKTRSRPVRWAGLGSINELPVRARVGPG